MIAKISAVQDKYSHRLLNMANVVGTAVGMKMVDDQVSDQMALVVMVSKKFPLDEVALDDRIPTELDGVPVDVIETGTFFAN